MKLTFTLQQLKRVHELTYEGFQKLVELARQEGVVKVTPDT